MESASYSFGAVAVRTLTFFLIWMFAVHANATLTTIDFENVSEDGNGALVVNGFVLDPGSRDWTPNAVPYSEGGPWTGHYHLINPSDTNWGVYNGTRFLGFDYFLDQSILNIYSASGAIFGVKQFDLAEGSYLNGSTSGVVSCPANRYAGITFVGYLADGGIISLYSSFDMICDGTGPLSDFQTFTFDGQWNRLTAFAIVPDHEYANPGLDNLILRTVPEPATALLICVGFAGMGFASRRRNEEEVGRHRSHPARIACWSNARKLRRLLPVLLPLRVLSHALKILEFFCQTCARIPIPSVRVLYQERERVTLASQ